MRVRVWQVGALSLAIAVAIGAGLGCSKFSADDANGPDGGVDAGTEGASGQRLVVHGFSKGVAPSSPAGGILTMRRPPGAEKNDVLLLVVGDLSVNPDVSAFSGNFTDRKGVCSNPNKNHLGFATRIDDGTASFDLPFSGGNVLTAVMVALGGVQAPSDFKLTNASSPDGGSAEPVDIPTQTGLVIVGFLSDVGRQQGDGRGVSRRHHERLIFRTRRVEALWWDVREGKDGQLRPVYTGAAVLGSADDRVPLHSLIR